MIVEFEGIKTEINPEKLDYDILIIDFVEFRIQFEVSDGNWVAVNGFDEQNVNIKSEIEGKILNFV